MRRMISFRYGTRDERGATALMIAIIVPVVLLGLGAIVVNVGGWYVARGMDQNAADAAAVAVAMTCAEGSCDASAADQYADGANNGQLAGEPWIVCGTAPGLTACDSAIENGQICPVASEEAPYVDVYVRPAGGTVGNPVGGTDQAVAACAQATISGPTSCHDCVALTISECEWRMNTTNSDGSEEFVAHEEDAGYTNGSPPSYVDTINARRTDSRYNAVVGSNSSNIYVTNGVTDPQNTDPPASIAGSETILYTHGPAMPGCGEAGNGANAPGNFGWLEDNDDCIAADPTQGAPGGSLGNTSLTECKALFQDSRDYARPIFLPVYTATASVGGNLVYELKGFAAFVVTGWNFGGTLGSAESRIAEADSGKAQFMVPGYKTAYCGKPNKGYVPTGSSSATCITGYFTQALVSADEVGGGGGDDLGVTVVSLAG